MPDVTWTEWSKAFAAACERCADEFRDHRETSSYIAPYVSLIERLLACEPPRPLPGIEPQAAPHVPPLGARCN